VNAGGLNWWQLVALLGALQGFVLAVALATRPTGRTPHRLLAGAILSFALFLATVVYYSADLVGRLPHLFGVTHPLPFLFGPLVYFYAVTASDRTRRLRWRDAWHAAPAALVLVLSVPIFLLSGAEKLAMFDTIRSGRVSMGAMLTDPLRFLSGGGYTVATLVVLRRHRQIVAENYSSLERVNLRWVQRLVFAAGGIWMLALGLQPAALLQLAKHRSNSPEFRAAVQSMYRPDRLKTGAMTGLGSDFLFVIDQETQPALALDGHPALPMRKIAGTSLWFVAPALSTGEAHLFQFMVDGKPFGPLSDLPAYGEDSYEQPNVPQGVMSEKMVHTSTIYPGMTSEYWVYTPPGYDPKIPLPLMVWQDGYAAAFRLGVLRLPVVTENLIAQKKIPPMIHVLISPGTVGDKQMRSIEYDIMDGTYARFLREEILADIGKRYSLRQDAYSRAIAGMSSGAVCAFNVAWLETDHFSRVGSFIGSYTAIGWRRDQPDAKDNLDAGTMLPIKVRKDPRRNIRVWLDDGANDMESKDGSWPLQNIQMANSLKLAGYDFHFHFGVGVHSLSSAASALPAALAWLWRDYDSAKTEQVYVQDEAEKALPLFRVQIINR